MVLLLKSLIGEVRTLNERLGRVAPPVRPQQPTAAEHGARPTQEA